MTPNHAMERTPKAFGVAHLIDSFTAAHSAFGFPIYVARILRLHSR